MPKSHAKRTRKREKLYPDPWLPHVKPSNAMIPYTSQPWNHWPPQVSMPQSPWNQLSYGHSVPVQSELLSSKIWNYQLQEPFIQQRLGPMFDQPLITTPSHSSSRAPLLPFPSRQPFNSDLPESASNLRGRAPLLPIPSSQPYNSYNNNGTIGPTRKKFDIFSSQDSSRISYSSEKRKQSPKFLNQHSSIDAEIKGSSKRHVFRKIEFNKNGELKIHVGSYEDEEEDVQYLYSVDSKIIEFIDLSQDIQTSNGQNSNTSVDSITEVNESRVSEYRDTSPITFNEKETCYAAERKNRQRAHCNKCHKSYENLHNNMYDLFSAKCEHMFCTLCLKKLDSNKCIICGKAALMFSKIIL